MVKLGNMGTPNDSLHIINILVPKESIPEISENNEISNYCSSKCKKMILRINNQSLLRIVDKEMIRLSQRSNIDFEEIYSPVVDASNFRYLISLVAYEELNLHQMNVITIYLYDLLDNDIYMKLLEGFNRLSEYLIK
ncbi:Copia protein, partial [Mucuna pruriens]